MWCSFSRDVGGADADACPVRAPARKLNHDVATATGGITASIGVASSKLLAKMGSDLHKPDGLTVVPVGDERTVLHPLPVSRLPGVGPTTQERLRRSGIHTVAQLAVVDLPDLVDWFGQAHGAGLYRLARANDDRPVVAGREANSVSARETFDVDLTDRSRLTPRDRPARRPRRRPTAHGRVVRAHRHAEDPALRLHRRRNSTSRSPPSRSARPGAPDRTSTTTSTAPVARIQIRTALSRVKRGTVPVVRHPELPDRLRLAAASVHGTVARYNIGSAAGAPLEAAVDGLRAISTEPVVFGHVLGTYRVRVENDARYCRGVDMLFAAGPDEDAAAAKEAWPRARIAERGGMILWPHYGHGPVIVPIPRNRGGFRYAASALLASAMKCS